VVDGVDEAVARERFGGFGDELRWDLGEVVAGDLGEVEGP
jgi:hypothetical protein